MNNNPFKALGFFALFKAQSGIGELWRYSQLKVEELINYLNSSARVSKFGLNYSANQFPTSKMRESGRMTRGAVTSDLPSRAPMTLETLAKEEGIYNLDNDLRFRRRLKIARQVATWIRLIPSIKFIAVANNLSFGVATITGDIDLFIVTSTQTISLTRALVAMFLVLLKLRPRVGRPDTVCASFFISEDNLELSRLTIPNDIYFKFWLGALLPIYDPDNLLKQMFLTNHVLLAEFPNIIPKSICPQFKLAVRTKWLDVFLPLFRAVEPITAQLQFKLFPSEIKNILNLDTRVVVTNQVLKFHTNDRREYFRDQLKDFCE